MGKELITFANIVAMYDVIATPLTLTAPNHHWDQ